MSTEGDALAAAGKRDEAMRWWNAAVRSLPKSIQLRPVEQSQFAAIELRLGERSAAQQAMSELAAIGYRHPAYLAAVKVGGRGT
jgi:anti-sigma factor RsiW